MPPREPGAARRVQTAGHERGGGPIDGGPLGLAGPLAGSDGRHVFIETIGRVSLYHYDLYAQLLSKVVRGFRRDLEDARMYLRSGMVDAVRCRALVESIPETAYAKYPAITREAVRDAVAAFLDSA